MLDFICLLVSFLSTMKVALLVPLKTEKCVMSNEPTQVAQAQPIPLLFPPSQKNNVFDKDDDSSQEMTFVEACKLAAERNRPLHLSQDISDLSETIVLRKRQQLCIVGRKQHAHQLFTSKVVKKAPGRIKITGNLHSLFLLNNHSQLQLQDLELIHQDDDDEDNIDCRKVGAAVNLRYKSNVRMNRCAIESQSGFCCWAVQKASVDLYQCFLEAPLRSAVVSFGNAKVVIRESIIYKSGVHGVCCRGECDLRLTNSSIYDSAVRGLYAYANASVLLDKCTISGTLRPDMAAVEVSSSSISTKTTTQNRIKHKNSDTAKGMIHKKSGAVQKTSSLTMIECHIIDNAGVAVRIRGNIRHNLFKESDGKNYFERNLNGNKVHFCSTNNVGDLTVIDYKLNNGEQENYSQLNNKIILKRDSSGSSFRKGDWWCLVCDPKGRRRIVQGSRIICSVCGSDKGNGKFLSSREVLELNRSGISAASNIGSDNKGDDDDVLPIIATVKDTNQNENIASNDHQITQSPEIDIPTWWFDGDDAGWLPYNSESNKKLEKTFQSIQYLESKFARLGEVENVIQEVIRKKISTTNIVSLSDGRYSVNLEKMEQINTGSHFMRLVQRKED